MGHTKYFGFISIFALFLVLASLPAGFAQRRPPPGQKPKPKPRPPPCNPPCSGKGPDGEGLACGRCRQKCGEGFPTSAMIHMCEECCPRCGIPNPFTTTAKPKGRK